MRGGEAAGVGVARSQLDEAEPARDGDRRDGATARLGAVHGPDAELTICVGAPAVRRPGCSEAAFVITTHCDRGKGWSSRLRNGSIAPTVHRAAGGYSTVDKLSHAQAGEEEPAVHSLGSWRVCVIAAVAELAERSRSPAIGGACGSEAAAVQAAGADGREREEVARASRGVPTAAGECQRDQNPSGRLAAISGRLCHTRHLQLLIHYGLPAGRSSAHVALPYLLSRL